jgi:DNA-binding transcriptional MerR regulator
MLIVFGFSEVAEIVGMPKALAKNWTVGRPLKLTPSVKDSGGTGSRNLYSVGDVYRMAFVNELWRAGFTLKAIQRVLDELEKKGEIFDVPDIWGLALYMVGLTTEIEVIPQHVKTIRLDGGISGAFTVKHLVCTAAIKARIDEEIKKHRGNSK